MPWESLVRLSAAAKAYGNLCTGACFQWQITNNSYYKSLGRFKSLRLYKDSSMNSQIFPFPPLPSALDLQGNYSDFLLVETLKQDILSPFVVQHHYCNQAGWALLSFLLLWHIKVLEGSENGGAASDHFWRSDPNFHFCSWVGQDAACPECIRIPLSDRSLKLRFFYAQLWVALITRFVEKVQALFCFTSSIYPNRPLLLQLHYQCQETALRAVQS